jgi:plasmid stability protein
MPVNLSIKNAPDDMVAKLKQRAARNHRSLQGELLVILDRAANDPVIDQGQVSLSILRDLERLGLRGPSESARMIREDRDR